ncbi:MAG: hypothetical protein OEZ57_08910 [Nitrospirota bacterium]|nr:hypothetical protein [Nitrospirota bacterium]
MISLPASTLPFIYALVPLLLGYQGPSQSLWATVFSDMIMTPPPQEVSITDLVKDPETFHQQHISVRGLVTQLELHLDESELHLDFVFRLSQGPSSILVYGRHDRTRGAPAMSMNETVEVVGLFWKKQNRNGISILNILEAINVAPYPSSIPSRT